MGAREGLGGLVAVALVIGGGYLRFQRMQARHERMDRNQAAAAAEHEEWKGHALDMMNQASASKPIREYLVWGVETYHAEARAETEDSFAPSGPAYRDLLITKIFDRARTDGREDITRLLEKSRIQAKLADPDTWWILDPKKRPK